MCRNMQFTIETSQSDAPDVSDASLRSDQIDVTGAVDFLSNRPPYDLVETWVSSDDLADATFELNVLAVTNGERLLVPLLHDSSIE